MKLTIFVASALLFSSLEARTVNTNYPISNEISHNRLNFRPKNNYGQGAKQNAPIVTAPTSALTPVSTGIQNLMVSPIIQAMLSNITIQTILSDPMVQGLLSNPTVQSVLSNPAIVQAFLTNPAIQGLAMQMFLSTYPSDINTAVAAATPTVPVTARPATTSVVNEILSGLDELIDLIQTQIPKRN